MPTQAVTFSEMMQTSVILRVVNRIQTPLSLFQKFFGHMSGDNSTATESIKGREAGWDIYDATRQRAGARAPGTPPRRIRKKPIGHVSAQLMRSHESIIIYDEQVYKTRSLGGQFGSMVDIRGQRHIQRQISFMTQRFRNTREWMYSRMLRGGFNMETDGDNYKLRNYDTSRTQDIRVNYQIPSDNQGRLQLGTGADILSNWALPTADIPAECLSVNEAMTRIHGRALRHAWIDTQTYINMQNNNVLRNVAGDAFEIFEFMTQRSGTSAEGIRDAGFTVRFRAMPNYLFHVYDGVLSADGETEGTSTSVMEKLVPSNYVIFLPEPDDTWHGLIDGSELVRENEMVATPTEAQGFYAWATPIIDPPGQELKFLDNYLPVLYVPNCVAYGFVGSD